ncbi:MAG TPA: hypothetical protein PL169_08085, partial [Leptospiraceae bacterium]|nr:hypothetical protein [Leptospiraceae bacterium]
MIGSIRIFNSALINVRNGIIFQTEENHKNIRLPKDEWKKKKQKKSWIDSRKKFSRQKLSRNHNDKSSQMP